jgi:hypothetical protein
LLQKLRASQQNSQKEFIILHKKLDVSQKTIVNSQKHILVSQETDVNSQKYIEQQKIRVLQQLRQEENFLKLSQEKKVRDEKMRF